MAGAIDPDRKPQPLAACQIVVADQLLWPSSRASPIVALAASPSRPAGRGWPADTCRSQWRPNRCSPSASAANYETRADRRPADRQSGPLVAREHPEGAELSLHLPPGPAPQVPLTPVAAIWADDGWPAGWRCSKWRYSKRHPRVTLSRSNSQANRTTSCSKRIWPPSSVIERSNFPLIGDKEAASKLQERLPSQPQSQPQDETSL